MKVELKPIIDQLSEALHLPKNLKVSALIDEGNNNEIVGWTIVYVNEDGSIEPIMDTIFETLEYLFKYGIDTRRN